LFYKLFYFEGKSRMSFENCEICGVRWVVHGKVPCKPMSHHVKIQIGAVGDPKLFPEMEGKVAVEGRVEHVGILEKGTESGATSLFIYITLPDESIVCAQMTASMLLSIAGAVRGAVERFGS